MSGPHPLIDRLTRERRARGLTCAEAGALIGFHRRTINHWEAGTRQPTLDDVEAYAGVLGFRIIAAPAEAADAVDADAGEQLPLGQLALDPGEKWCPSCQQVRSRCTDFHVDRSRRDGLYARCKTCVAEEYQQRKGRGEPGQREAAA